MTAIVLSARRRNRRLVGLVVEGLRSRPRTRTTGVARSLSGAAVVCARRTGEIVHWSAGGSFDSVVCDGNGIGRYPN